MDIKARNIPVANPRTAHIAFIRENQSRSQRIDRISGMFVVVADSGDHLRDLVGFHPHFVENTERHDRAGLGMINAVDNVSDVVHKTGDPRKLDGTGIVPQLGKNVLRHRRNPHHMGEAVLCVAERNKRGVCLTDIAFDLLAGGDVLIGDHTGSPFLFFA